MPTALQGGEHKEGWRHSANTGNSYTNLQDTPLTTPCSISAERAVLGIIIMGPELLHEASSILSSDDFYDPRNRNIYNAICVLSDDDVPVSELSLAENSTDRCSEFGGADYLASISDEALPPSNLDYFISVIKKKARLRSIIQTANNLQHLVRNKADDDDLLAVVEDQLSELVQQGAGEGGEVPVRQAISDAIDEMERAHAHKGECIGVPTGFSSLDRLTTGMHPGDMVVLAARPGTGKTSLALNVADHVAVDRNTPVGIFSAEMTAVQLIKRMIASRGRVDGRKMISGELSPAEISSCTTASSKINKAPLYIDESQGLEINMLKAKARRMKMRHGIKLLIIDYIQLLHAKAESRVQEVSKISNSIKDIAKELKLPVLALSQLNRNVESQNREPKLSDLRDSGAIEQDADMVWLIHWNEPIVDLAIAKNRNGPCANIELEFIAKEFRFRPAL